MSRIRRAWETASRPLRISSTSSRGLVTTHIHDNRRQADDHLVPFQGSIDWPAAVMAFEKIGYDGVLMYEVKAAQSTGVVLEHAVSARKRLAGFL